MTQCFNNHDFAFKLYAISVHAPSVQMNPIVEQALRSVPVKRMQMKDIYLIISCLWVAQFFVSRMPGG